MPYNDLTIDRGQLAVNDAAVNIASTNKLWLMITESRSAILLVAAKVLLATGNLSTRHSRQHSHGKYTGGNRVALSNFSHHVISTHIHTRTHTYAHVHARPSHTTRRAHIVEMNDAQMYRM